MVHIFCFELILLMEVRFGTQGSSNHPSLFFSPFGLNICEITQMISCTEHVSVYARWLDVAEWEMEFTQNIQGTPPKTSNLKKHTPKWRRKIIFQTKLPFLLGCVFMRISTFQPSISWLPADPWQYWRIAPAWNGHRSKHTRYHETSFNYDFNIFQLHQI